MQLIRLTLQSIYFLVPAYFANMAPVVAKKIKILKSLEKPIDSSFPKNNRPVFGKNKTWRGITVAIITGIILAFFQQYLYNFPFFRWVSLFDYSSPLIFGFLMGTGAIMGDLIKSYFKRRVNISPGQSFVPFDQVDFVIGAYLFVLPFYSHLITLPLFILSLVASFLLDIIVNHISFYLGIRMEKW